MARRLSELAGLIYDARHDRLPARGTGAGSAEHWGVTGEVDVLMGTLGKALGVGGAFIASAAHALERIDSLLQALTDVLPLGA